MWPQPSKGIGNSTLRPYRPESQTMFRAVGKGTPRWPRAARFPRPPAGPIAPHGRTGWPVECQRRPERDAHTGRVLVLPLGIDRKRNVGGPTRHGAGRQQDRVAHRLVATAATVEHPREHRHIQVGVVIDSHLLLAVVQTVQSADVLGNRPAPGNGNVKKSVSSRASSKPSPM